MNRDIQLKITEQVLEDMFDCNLQQLRDLHLSYVLNVHWTLQQITKTDVSEELISKHKNLTKKIISMKKKKNE